MTWKAGATISGIPVVTEADLEAMQQIIPGVIEHSSQDGVLYLTWRFVPSVGYGGGPIAHASYQWRSAVNKIAGINKLDAPPICEEFHVRQVSPEEEAEIEAEVKKIFEKAKEISEQGS